MATKFILRSNRGSGLATIFARIQSPRLKVNLRLSTTLQVDVKKWNLSRDSVTFQNFAKSETGEKLFGLLRDIEKRIDSVIDSGTAITSAGAQDIINATVYGEVIKTEKQRLAEKEKITLNSYIAKYIFEAETGARQTNRGTNFSQGSLKAIKQAMKQFELFQKETAQAIDFSDVDMEFYKKFTAYLKKKEYAINTIGKVFKELKAILSNAQSEGFHNNSTYLDKKFKAHRIDVDSIYLTQEELDAIMSVDLSGMPKCYEECRDVFLAGVWSAQRVSDYHRITSDNVRTVKRKIIKDNKIVEVEHVSLEIVQQKTKQKVSIPCNAELRAILAKYDYKLPYLFEQKINLNIKKIGFLAGLTDMVQIVSTKGGVSEVINIEKYKLIHSHTARRTGATLMFLSGMDIFDICKITGHSTPQMLKKYIKASTLEIDSKLRDKYNYFD